MAFLLSQLFHHWVTIVHYGIPMALLGCYHGSTMSFASFYKGFTCTPLWFVNHCTVVWLWFDLIWNCFTIILSWYSLGFTWRSPGFTMFCHYFTMIFCGFTKVLPYHWHGFTLALLRLHCVYNEFTIVTRASQCKAMGTIPMLNQCIPIGFQRFWGSDPHRGQPRRPESMDPYGISMNLHFLMSAHLEENDNDLF